MKRNTGKGVWIWTVSMNIWFIYCRKTQECLRRIWQKKYIYPLRQYQPESKKMEKEGIIKGYGVKIDPLKLGFHITAFINMELEPVQKPEFYPFIESIPNVIECNCVTGNYFYAYEGGIPEYDWVGWIHRTAPAFRKDTDTDCILYTGWAEGFYLVSFLIDQADITVLQCSMPAAGEAWFGE